MSSLFYNLEQNSHNNLRQSLLMDGKTYFLLPT